MKKSGVVGGQSIVFTRYYEVDITKIRSHQIKDAKLCKNVLGLDANSLYPSTMQENMPCGKEKVHYCNTTFKAENQVNVLINKIKNNKWFDFAIVDIYVPKHLWSKFEEMPPFFFKKIIPKKSVPKHMLEYLEKTGRKKKKTEKLVGALSAKKILVFEPFLRWYIEHGLEITAVYTTMDYKPKQVFNWFVDEVTAARRTGDEDKTSNYWQ